MKVFYFLYSSLTISYAFHDHHMQDKLQATPFNYLAHPRLTTSTQTTSILFKDIYEPPEFRL